MSLFILKIIGIITMFIDHYHYIIGGPLILNIIGRIAFPIFSFSLGEGYFYTGNFKKYIGRLSFFAIISQIPAYIFKLDYPMNIFFTLLFGLIIIKIFYSRKIPLLIKVILIGGLVYVAEKYNFDYGMYGILTIVLFSIFRRKKILIFCAFLGLNILLILIPEIFNLAKIQMYSMLSLIPIFSYNGKKGKNMKYFFYVFYPAHFLVLEGIKYIIDKF